MSEPEGPTVIRLTGLSRAEAADLEDLLGKTPLGDEELRLEEESLPSHRLGEPVTFILLASVSMAAIGVLGSFLMKRREREDLRYSVEVVYPDGTKKTEILELSRRQSEAPDPELVEKLAAMTSLPVDRLAAMLD